MHIAILCKQIFCKVLEQHNLLDVAIQCCFGGPGLEKSHEDTITPTR